VLTRHPARSSFWATACEVCALTRATGAVTLSAVVDTQYSRPHIIAQGFALLFDTLDDARRKLALWRYDYNNVRPHSFLGNQTPARARRALEGTAHDALAQNDDEEYEFQTRKLSL